MGMLSRMSIIVKAKMNRILDSSEDPSETLDYSYEKQMENLRNVKRGVVEMVTTKRRLELQAAKVQESIAKLDTQARQAVEMGREDLARLALETEADGDRRAPGAGPADLRSGAGAGKADARRATSSGQGTGVPHPEKRLSRPSTARRRLRSASAPPYPESLRRWATSRWPSSVPRARRSR